MGHDRTNMTIQITSHYVVQHASELVYDSYLLRAQVINAHNHNNPNQKHSQSMLSIVLYACSLSRVMYISAHAFSAIFQRDRLIA